MVLWLQLNCFSDIHYPANSIAPEVLLVDDMVIGVRQPLGNMVITSAFYIICNPVPSLFPQGASLSLRHVCVRVYVQTCADWLELPSHQFHTSHQRLLAHVALGQLNCSEKSKRRHPFYGGSLSDGALEKHSGSRRVTWRKYICPEF